jgi:hypothetical protein
MISDPRLDASAEDEKTEQRQLSGEDRQQGWEAQKVRQGDIILKRPVQRWIFFGGVVAAAIFGIVIVMLAGS